MTLLRFELKKILSNKLFWFALAALLILNGLDVVRPWSNDDAIRREVNAGAGEMYTFLETADGAEIETYLKSETPRFFENIGKEKWANADYQSYLSQCEDTRILRKRFADNARSLGRAALDAGDDYGVRRNIAIVKAYSEDQAVGVRPTYGWDAFFPYYLDDVCVLLLVVLAVMLSQLADRASHADTVLLTTKRGRGVTLLVKAAAISLLAMVFTVVFTAANLLFVHWRYGLWTWSAPAWAVSCLAAAPLNGPIWQMVGLFTLYEAAGGVLLGCLLTCFFTALRRPHHLIIMSAALVALWTGCAFAHTPWVAAFSVYVWAQPMQVLAQFADVNVFSFSVPTAILYAAVWSVVICLVVIVGRFVWKCAKKH